MPLTTLRPTPRDDVTPPVVQAIRRTATLLREAQRVTPSHRRLAQWRDALLDDLDRVVDACVRIAIDSRATMRLVTVARTTSVGARGARALLRVRHDASADLTMRCMSAMQTLLRDGLALELALATAARRPSAVPGIRTWVMRDAAARGRRFLETA